MDGGLSCRTRPTPVGGVRESAASWVGRGSRPSSVGSTSGCSPSRGRRCRARPVGVASPNREVLVNRGEIGRREFGRATAGRGLAATGRVREASPVLAAGVEEFIFADVFSRSGLPARERELLTVAVLAALGGADNQLGVHAPAALDCGADPEDLIQLCEQLAPYAGFPRALNALRAVRTVLEERGLPLPLAVRDVELREFTTLAATVGEGDEGILLV